MYNLLNDKANGLQKRWEMRFALSKPEPSKYPVLSAKST
jgi:hypothetical protein